MLVSIVSTRNSIASLESEHKDRNIGLFHKIVNTIDILSPRAIIGTSQCCFGGVVIIVGPLDFGSFAILLLPSSLTKIFIHSPTELSLYPFTPFCTLAPPSPTGTISFAASTHGLTFSNFSLALFFLLCDTNRGCLLSEWICVFVLTETTLLFFPGLSKGL